LIPTIHQRLYEWFHGSAGYESFRGTGYYRCEFGGTFGLGEGEKSVNYFCDCFESEMPLSTKKNIARPTMNTLAVLWIRIHIIFRMPGKLNFFFIKFQYAVPNTEHFDTFEQKRKITIKQCELAML
jgi:hypothetical protein